MFIVCALLLCVNVVLGGGTRAGLLSDAVLQLISVAGLVAVLFRWDRIRATAGSHVFYLIGAIVMLPLLQLVPLPAQVVSLLEPNTTVVDTLRLVGLDPSFRALSAAPYATALSALSLLPPMTLLLAMLTLTGSERRSLCLVLVGLCLISIVLGLLQLASGSNSALRFYAFTNYDDAVGFFANRNHFSALIYCMIVFVVALMPQSDTARPEKKRKPETSAFPDAAMLAVWTGAIFVLVVAVMMARSRAGILLAMTGLAMAPLINKRMSRILPDKATRRVAILVVGLVALFVFGGATATSLIRLLLAQLLRAVGNRLAQQLHHFRRLLLGLLECPDAVRLGSVRLRDVRCAPRPFTGVPPGGSDIPPDLLRRPRLRPCPLLTHEHIAGRGIGPHPLLPRRGLFVYHSL